MGCSCSYHDEIGQVLTPDSIHSKVLITGLRKVGKTSILQSAWWDSPEKLNTKSCLCYSKKINLKGTTTYIDIWDSALVSSTYFIDMNALILVIDLSNPMSLNIDIKKVKKFSNNIIVVGNKFDISQQDVYQNTQKLAKHLNGFFIPVSVKTGFGLKDIWDMVLYLISE